jgi:hypothetical protein
MNYFEGRTSSTTSYPAPAMTMPPLISPSDFTRFVNEGLLRPVLQGLTTAATNFSDSIAALGGTTAQMLSTSKKAKDCGCGQTDPCHCNCCITDADLVINARLGETRVVPVSIENKWRRERSIKLDLSDFTRRGGAAGNVTAELLPPAPEFKLAPCGQQTIVMVVRAGDILNNRENIADVDDCTVYYADLRVTGCDIRPVRIAVALLPRDCGSYRIECSSSCCC